MEQPKSKKLSVQTILIFGFLVLIVVAVGFGFYIMKEIQKQNAALLLAQQQEQVAVVQPLANPETAAGKGFVLDENNLEAVMDQVQAEIDDGMFTANMSTIWTFKDAADPAIDAFLANDESNTKPFAIELTLDETGESLFTSTIIPVGKQMKEIKLSRDLAMGTYPATVTYNLLDKNNKVVGTFAVAVTIAVQE